MASNVTSLRRIPKSNVTPEKLIGEGGFGKVLKAEYCKGEMVALKILHTAVRVEKHHEFNIMSQFKSHPNLVALIGIIDNEPNACPELVYQYVPNGNLLDYVSKNNCSKKTLLKVGADIINGMEFLHNLHYPHGTLAARNILMDENCNAKISDYGISKILDGHGSNYYKIQDEKTVPIRWIPKECIPSNLNPECSFTFQSDVWAFGVVLWEACTKGDVPYGAICSNTQVLQLILNGSNPLAEKSPDICPGGFKKIMESIFKEDPEDRPTFMDLRKTFDLLQEQQTMTEARKEEKKSLKAQEKSLETEKLDQPKKVNPKLPKFKDGLDFDPKKSSNYASGGGSTDQAPRSDPIPERKQEQRREFNRSRPPNPKYDNSHKNFDGQHGPGQFNVPPPYRPDPGKSQPPRQNSYPNRNPKYDSNYSHQHNSSQPNQRQQDQHEKFSNSSYMSSNSNAGSSGPPGQGNYSQQQMPPTLVPTLGQPNFYPMMNPANPAGMMYPNMQPGMQFNTMQPQMPMYPTQMQPAGIQFQQNPMPLQVTVNQGGTQQQTPDKNLEEEVKNLQETVKRLESLQLEANKKQQYEQQDSADFTKSSQQQHYDRKQGNFRSAPYRHPSNEPRRNQQQNKKAGDFMFAEKANQKPWSHQEGHDSSQTHQDRYYQNQYASQERPQYADQNPRQQHEYSKPNQNNSRHEYQNQNSRQQQQRAQGEADATNKMVGDVTAAAVAAAVKGAIRAAKSANKSEANN